MTEADIRLYPTLIRYDSVYATLFKCSKRRVADYPHLKAWLRRMYNLRVSSGASMQARGLPSLVLAFCVQSLRAAMTGSLSVIFTSHR